MSKKIKIYLCVLAAIMTAFLLTSCSGDKEVKKVSEESKIAQEAFNLADTIKNAYIRNDRETLEKVSTKDGYRDIIGVRKNFDSAELTFTPTWVDIQDSVVNLTVSWKGTWTVKDKVTEERGIAVFVFEEKPLLLARIQRANPFRQPE
jgi:hypothetical protein